MLVYQAIANCLFNLLPDKVFATLEGSGVKLPPVYIYRFLWYLEENSDGYPLVFKSQEFNAAIFSIWCNTSGSQKSKMAVHKF